MTVESIQDVVHKAVGIWWLLCPLWLCSAAICFPRRRNPRVVPLWAFMATPVLCLYVMVALMVARTSSLGPGPDNGWVGMGTTFLVLFVIPELATGALLLVAVPRRPAWNSRVVIPCIAAVLLSVAACAAATRFVPNPRRPPRNVEIVVPDGFRGLIVIKEDKKNGLAPERTWRVTRYTIPASGKLLTTDAKPLSTWHENYGRYTSGAELPMLDTSRQDGEGFLTMGSNHEGYLMWVGSKWEHDHFQRANDPRRPKPRKADDPK